MHFELGGLYERDGDLEELLDLANATLIHHKQDNVILGFNDGLSMCDNDVFPS